MTWSTSAVVLGLLAGAASFASAQDPERKPKAAGDVAAPDTATITSLGADLRALRKIKGHFDGGTESIPDVDHFGGRKHQVMTDLFDAIKKTIGSWDRKKLVELLGEPDRAMRGEGDPRFPVAPAESCELLIYTWRGYHDFFYVEVGADGRATRTGYWFALE
jgi:hypothetical protein